MKNKLLVIAILLLASLTVSARYTPTTYEYKFEYSAKEKRVNELASQGWELVAIESGGETIASAFVFKRAK